MSLITCGLADIIIFAELIPWQTTVVSVDFIEEVLTEEFEIQSLAVEFNTDILQIEFDPSPRIVEGC